MNEVQMQELIEAIEKLSQKGWVDYLIIIVPIMLSVIAVWISLATARKQNKIALFEKRYRAVSQIEKIVDFANLIALFKETNTDEGLTDGIVLNLFDTTFGTEISEQRGKAAWLLANRQLMLIESEILAFHLVVDKIDQDVIEGIYRIFKVVIYSAVRNESRAFAQEDLCSLCKKYEKDIRDQLLKKIKI